MLERKHYNNAPIIQALIDVQVKSPRLVDLATLVSPPKEITTDYPAKPADTRDLRNSTINQRGRAIIAPFFPRA